MTIQAAIFDMDGLLIDSEPLWRRAEQAAFKKVGISLTDAECAQTTGLRTDEVVRYWHERRPWDAEVPGTSHDDVRLDIENRVVRLVEDEGQALPGVRHALDVSKRLGLRIALASSSPPRLIDAVLHGLGISERFELTCSAAHEEHGKPHPAVFLTTASQLDVPPKSCVVLEDSLPGVRAGLAAGMRVVAVPAPEDRGHDGFGRADVLLNSLDDLREAHLTG